MKRKLIYLTSILFILSGCHQATIPQPTSQTESKIETHNIELSPSEEGIIEYNNNSNNDVTLLVSRDDIILKKTTIPANTNQITNFHDDNLADEGANEKNTYKITLESTEYTLNGDLTLNTVAYSGNEDIPTIDSIEATTPPADIDNKESVIDTAIHLLNTFYDKAYTKDYFTNIDVSFYNKNQACNNDFWFVMLLWENPNDRYDSEFFTFYIDANTLKLIKFDALEKGTKIQQLSSDDYNKYADESIKYVDIMADTYTIKQQSFYKKHIISEFETNNGSVTIELSYPDMDVVGIRNNDIMNEDW